MRRGLIPEVSLFYDLLRHDVARRRFEAGACCASEKVWRGGGAAFRCFVDSQVREAQPIFAVRAEIAVAFHFAEGIEAAIRHCAVDVQSPYAGAGAQIERLKLIRRGEQHVIGRLKLRFRRR